MSAKQVQAALSEVGVLIADYNQYSRKLLRAMLLNLGVRAVYEAGDGATALDLVRTAGPEIMIIDWALPVLSGMQVVQIVRSPGVFPRPDLPIIMLSANATRGQVISALQIGVNEFLARPVSPQALRNRLVACLVKPRPMRQIGNFYVPHPRACPSSPSTEQIG